MSASALVVVAARLISVHAARTGRTHATLATAKTAAPVSTTAPTCSTACATASSLVNSATLLCVLLTTATMEGHVLYRGPATYVLAHLDLPPQQPDVKQISTSACLGIVRMVGHVWKAMALQSVVAVHQSTPVTHAKMPSALLTTALTVERVQSQDLTTCVLVHLGTTDQGVRMTKMVSVTLTDVRMEEHV